VNPISEHEMLEQTSLYDEEDVRGTLMRINGGVTSEVLKNATDVLKVILWSTFKIFSKTGHRSEAELQGNEWSSNDEMRRFLRIGAPDTYNMKCYSMAFPPATVADFLNAGQGDGIDCRNDMFMWMYNEDANATRYNTKYPSRELGRPGIQQQCFRYFIAIYCT
jgi:hypothetical protein